MKYPVMLLSIFLFSANALAGTTTFGNVCATPDACIDGLYCDDGTCIKSSQTSCSATKPCSIGQSCFKIDTSTFSYAVPNVVVSAAAEKGLCGNAASGVNNNAFQQSFCVAYGFITGSVGKGVSVFAVVSVGIFFFLGKVTWGSAAAVVIAIGTIYGAPMIVSVLTGSSVLCKAS